MRTSLRLAISTLAALTVAVPFRALAEKFTFIPPEPLKSGAEVTLIGSFNDWDEHRTPLTLEESSGRYTTTIDLADGDYSYRYAVFSPGEEKAEYFADATWPVYVADGKGNVNNLLVLEDGVRIAPEDLELIEFATKPVSRVEVAGDFCKWTPGEVVLAKVSEDQVARLQTWRALIRVKRPFTYKILLDGIWDVSMPGEDEAHVPDGFGGVNTIRRVSAASDPFGAASGMGELDPEASEKVLQEAREMQTSQDPTIAADGFVREANWQRRNGKPEELARVWTTMRLRSDIPYEAKRQALHELGSFYLHSTRQVDEALRAYGEMLANETDPVRIAEASLQIATAHNVSGNSAEAYRRLDYALSQLPTLADADPEVRELVREIMHSKAQWLVRDARCVEAMPILDKIIEYAPVTQDPKKASAERMKQECGG